MSSVRWILGLAAVAIGFSAADTYVVVLALPDMMTTADLALDELQRAAPIISGFLLGYVAMLPIIGRICDIRGRLPVLVGSLLVFAVGSVVTAVAYDLSWMVAGRLIQGIGGGGLIPPTLALIAEAWPPEKRGLPLGVVGAVQELGSVLGPLYGAVVLSFGTWRSIFWLNAAVGLVLVAGFLTAARSASATPDASRARRPAIAGLGLLALSAVGFVLVMVQPEFLTSGVTTGLAFLPLATESRWLSPLSLATLVAAGMFLAHQARTSRPLVQWRTWPALRAQIDLWGAGGLTLALGAIIVTFAAADPERSVISGDAVVLLPVAALGIGIFIARQRTAPVPLIPHGTLAKRPAQGAIIASFFIGAALIAALVDIPFFARLTIATNDQLAAALVLVRFLVALPIGALLGGWLTRYIAPAALTAIAMTLTCIGFIVMANWGPAALTHEGSSDLVLIVGGLGFGLGIAPVNAALLDHTPHEAHGVASSLVIVARMVGMLIGISVLTTLGMRAFQHSINDLPSVQELCGSTQTCRAYALAVRDAGLDQLHVVFAGAAASAAVAGLVALLTLGHHRVRVNVDT